MLMWRNTCRTDPREIMMKLEKLMTHASLSCAGVSWLLSGVVVARAQARGVAALTGLVTSAEEGPMEGVLISAKRDGSNITITVVSDQKGEYSFPAGRLDPGHYTIAIRAGGYDLDGPKALDIAGGGSKADIKLIKTRNLASQLTNAEWMLSAPGPDNVKGNLINCVECHTVQRIFASTHDAAEFKQLFRRMGTYSPGSTPTHPQPLLPGPPGERPPIPESQFDVTADWLASVNMSTSDTRSFELKTLPRPKRVATRVIYTEY